MLPVLKGSPGRVTNEDQGYRPKNDSTRAPPRELIPSAPAFLLFDPVLRLYYMSGYKNLLLSLPRLGP